MLRTLDGCSWLDAGGEPVCDTIQIAEPGINVLSVAEQYTTKDVKEASVLSIDEIMQIIDDGVKERKYSHIYNGKKKALIIQYNPYGWDI